MFRTLVNKNLVKFNIILILLIYLIPSNLNKLFNGFPIIEKFDLFFISLFHNFIKSRISKIKYY